MAATLLHKEANGRGESATRLLGDKRQKNKLVSAFLGESRREALTASEERTESSAGKRGTESPAIAEPLMEEVCGRRDCKRAWNAYFDSLGMPGLTGGQ